MTKKPPRLATIISDHDQHFIDHLAPLSEILNIPMIVSDEIIECLVSHYYPNVKVIYKTPIDLACYLVKNFEIIYTCLPTPLFRELVFAAEISFGKTLLNIWCPHGNSDKGHQAKYMETLLEERFALVYGQKMMNFLSEKGSLDQLECVIQTGNYRLKYYNKNKTFYQEKLKEHIPFKSQHAQLNSLESTSYAQDKKRYKKTILYAPTWQDDEHSSSFEGAITQIIQTLPDHFNLVIKPHPHLLTSPELMEIFLSQLPQKETIAILPDFPPVYPLLDFVDIYLGDMSSIGYDFLSFRKPMFFLNPNTRNPQKDKGLYLTQCGTLINPEDYENIFSIIENKKVSSFEKIQTAIYDQVFGIEEDLKQKIIAIYEKTCENS